MRAGRRGRVVLATYVEAHRRAAATFFRWCVTEGALARSPMERVERVRVKRRQIVILQPNEMDRLLAAADCAQLGARNRAVLAMAYDVGLRAGELSALRVSDLDLAAGVCTVRGKTGEDQVPISMVLRAELLRYLRARPRAFPFADDGWLFTGRRGGPLTPNAVKLMLRRAATRAGIIGKRVYPHLLRHSFGTQYVRNGGDALTLQRILRHRTSSTSQLYVHLATADDVRERHAAASPLARLRPLNSLARER